MALGASPVQVDRDVGRWGGPPRGGELSGRPEHVAPAAEAGELVLLVPLMSAGRLQVFDERASLRDRRARVLIRLTDGRELRLREFGTKQRAWAKLMEAELLDDDEMVATLGPEAWPAPADDQPDLGSPVSGGQGHRRHGGLSRRQQRGG